MKKLFALYLILFFTAAYAGVGDRYVEKTGGFAFSVPQGWQLRDFPGLKYKIAVGPIQDQFAANINIVEEAYKGPLKEYVDLNVGNLKKMMSQFTLLNRKSFKTSSGLAGEKLTTTSMQQDRLLRQSFYVFSDGRGRYLVVTGSVWAKGGEALDPVFDESLRTFALIQ